MNIKMKIIAFKTAALLSVFFIIIGLASLPAYAAAGDITLTVNSATAAAGADVLISVNIPENSGVVCGDLLLKFNNTKLTVKSAVKGVAAQGLCSINPNYIPDGSGISTIKEAFATLDPITLGGSMMDITFTVLPGWTGSTTLALTADGFYITVDNIDIPITANVINGSIYVLPKDNFVRIKNGNMALDDTYGKKIGIFNFYRNVSLKLDYDYSIDSGEIAKVEWLSDNSAVDINKVNGFITNKGTGARSSKITLNLTLKNGMVLSDTVKVYFYKFDWQIKNLKK